MEFHQQITLFAIASFVLFYIATSGRQVDSDETSREVRSRGIWHGCGGEPTITTTVSCNSHASIGSVCRCSNSSTMITCATSTDPCRSTGPQACTSVAGFNCTCDSCKAPLTTCPIDYFPRPHMYCTDFKYITTNTTGNLTSGTTTQPEVTTGSDEAGASSTNPQNPVKTTTETLDTDRMTQSEKTMISDMPMVISTESQGPAETTSVATDRMLAEMLLNISSDPETITPLELKTIIQDLSRLEEAGSTDTNVTSFFISVVNNVMVVSRETLEQVPNVASVPQLLEDQLSHTHENVGNYTQVEENVAVSLLKVNVSSFERPVEYMDPLDVADNGTDGTSISLPSSILDIILQDSPNISSIPLTFIVYRDTDIFLTSEEEGEVMTSVISAKVDIEAVDVKDLPKPVVIEFTLQMKKGNLTTNLTNDEWEIVCAFWDYSLDSMMGKWSTDGCNTNSTLNNDGIICHCNHLTSFAVLVRGTKGPNDSFAQVLSTITTIGCCISIGCLIACLLLMLLVKSVRVKQETRVHINLCISLLGLYLTFVIGIERTDNAVICKIIAACIHFFCLASVAWMAVEAFVVYRLIYKYERSDSKFLIPCSMIFAWGMPAVAAALVYAFDDDFPPETPEFCFLHQGDGFYYGFLLLAFLFTAYNSVVFTLATYRMTCRSVNAVDKKAKRKEILQRVYSTILFWVLLGISWLFGFLSAFQNPTSPVFQLLFCVFLTLQGLFLFYFIFAQNPIMKAKVTYILTDQSGSWRFFFRNSRDEVPLARSPTSREPSNVSKIETNL